MINAIDEMLNTMNLTEYHWKNVIKKCMCYRHGLFLEIYAIILVIESFKNTAIPSKMFKHYIIFQDSL
jgi:hypothetical protein